MRSAAAQTGFLLAQYDRLLQGLDDEHLAWAPAPGGKTAGWLLGHLVITGDFARRLCGQAPMTPKEWRPAFAPGTQPSADRAAYPPMARLVEAFRAVYGALAREAAEAPREAIEGPNPFEPTRGAFPSAGDFARYIMTAHLGYHLGQLSGWRDAAAAAHPVLRRD